MEETTGPKARYTTGVLAAFSSPAFGLAALGLPIVAILPPLYAELGMGLSVVGAVFMTARFFDVFTDPVFGVLGDKVQTRWGRRKPAIAAGLPVLCLGVFLLFMPSPPITEAKLLTALLTLYAGWTLVSLAHTAWASELSGDYDQRSRIMGSLQVFGLIGVVTILLIPAVADVVLDNTGMELRTSIMGWTLLASLPLFTAVALIVAPEPRIVPTPRLNWREAWRSLVANRVLRRLLLADLLVGAQGGINGSVHFFFVGHVLLLPESASIFLVVIFLAGLVCVPLFVKLSSRFGKHRTLCFCAFQSSLATASFFVLPAGSFWIAAFAYLMVGVTFGAKDLLMRSIMADVIDLDRVEVGAERSALYYSMLTLTNKAGAALAVGMIYPVLDWVGFDPAGVNDAATLDGVRIVVAATPTLVFLAMAVIMWNFPIDRKRQQQLRATIEARIDIKPD